LTERSQDGKGKESFHASLMPTVKPRGRQLTALDYAYRLLARRAYSEQELGTKLRTKGFTAEAVNHAVMRLKTQGYLDDARLVADQVERLRVRGFGPAAIRTKLTQKGLPTDLIEAILVGAADQDRRAARRFLGSRFTADALKDPQTRARAFRLLLRRGYASDVAEYLLNTERDDT
jgi:regulatory protein